MGRGVCKVHSFISFAKFARLIQLIQFFKDWASAERAEEKLRYTQNCPACGERAELSSPGRRGLAKFESDADELRRRAAARVAALALIKAARAPAERARRAALPAVAPRAPSVVDAEWPRALSLASLGLGGPAPGSPADRAPLREHPRYAPHVRALDGGAAVADVQVRRERSLSSQNVPSLLSGR